MNFKNEILRLLKDYKLTEDMLEVPPNQEMGDYAFPCFILAKKLKKAPNDIAEEILRKIKPNKYIKKIESKGAYLNFFVNKEILSSNVLQKIIKERDSYGFQKANKKIYMVEYFHANTHKGVHIGHIRNISLAEAICKVLEASGYKVIRANYQGDIGPHVAKCIWGYLNLKEKEPKEKRGTWLGKVYSQASRKAENKKVEEEIREINNKLYAKDKSLMKIWKKTRQYCLDDFENFYKEFGVKFDRLYFESEVEEPGKKIVKDMIKNGTAEKSDGAIIIDLKKYDLGVYVLLTQDGNALYSTKDLGLAELKEREFKFDKSIHITGAEQRMHFMQLFKTFEIIGSKMAKKSLHIPYGLVMLPEGKMSSRSGTMVLFDDLREKIFNTAEKSTKLKHEGLSKKEIDERAKKIAYAAIKFSMINRENNKDIVFDWKRALDFEGETGPYVQYTYARISSILRKYNKKVSEKVNYSLYDDTESQIIRKLEAFPEIIGRAAEGFKPSFVSSYLIELCSLFNEYYHKYPILKADEDVMKSRLLLISCIRTVISNGLYLLGIETLERM